MRRLLVLALLAAAPAAAQEGLAGLRALEPRILGPDCGTADTATLRRRIETRIRSAGTITTTVTVADSAHAGELLVSCVPMPGRGVRSYVVVLELNRPARLLGSSRVSSLGVWGPRVNIAIVGNAGDEASQIWAAIDAELRVFLEAHGRVNPRPRRIGL